jgi:hypothetical protein
MLPAADVSVFTREIRARQQREQEAGRAARFVMTSSRWLSLPGLPGPGAALAASDTFLFLRGQRGIPRFGGFGGFGGPGPGGPGGPRPNTDRARQDRQKLVAFLKANHNNERWAIAVSGTMQASMYIIEDDLSVMPLGGFNGGSPTLGTDPEAIKARLTKMVEDGQIRFFQVATFRGGVPGRFGGGRAGVRPDGAPGGGRPGAAGDGRPGVPPGGGRVAGGPPMGRGGSATVSEWIRELEKKGKAKPVDRKLYTAQAPPEAGPGGRRPGRGFGMMGGGELYDLRPELGLRTPTTP